MAGFDGTGGDASLLDEKAPSRNLLLQVTGFWPCSLLRRKPVVYTLTVVTDLRGSLPLFVSKSHNEDSCSAHSIDEETYCAAQYC